MINIKIKTRINAITFGWNCSWKSRYYPIYKGVWRREPKTYHPVRWMIKERFHMRHIHFKD